MNRKRMHALLPLPYASETMWTLCGRHVERDAVTTFPEDVACRQCIANMERSEQFRRDRANERGER